jgi:hypothetical protein
LARLGEIAHARELRGQIGRCEGRQAMVGMSNS